MPPRKSVSLAAAGDAPPTSSSPTSSKTPAEASVLTESGNLVHGTKEKEKGPRQSTGKDQDGMGIDVGYSNYTAPRAMLIFLRTSSCPGL